VRVTVVRVGVVLVRVGDRLACVLVAVPRPRGDDLSRVIVLVVLVVPVPSGRE
jgi:hypothetical protein